MTGGRGVEEARANIGRRVHWPHESVAGTITGVSVGRGGWPVYRVDWDFGAPEWWAVELSTRSRLIVEAS